MIIKESTASDKVLIVDLLKQSLSEKVTKKTESIWNFKHELNPFGASYVLVAFDEQMLVGVRAFMQWRWQLNDKLIVAYRAVDTATHPNHQGKGIFVKLTQQALSTVEKKEDCFIFNTPNEKSLPGYLKMGWRIIDALPIAIVPAFMYFYYNFFKKVIFENNIGDDKLEEICTTHNDSIAKQNKIFTPKSTAYLRWRFENNPMQEYKVVSDNDFYLVMYVKRRKYSNELRISELICSNTSDQHKIKSLIIKYAFKNKCWFISSADKKMFKFRLYAKIGPKLTLKPLNQGELFINKAFNIHNWVYSLGDLELF